MFWVYLKNLVATWGLCRVYWSNATLVLSSSPTIEKRTKSQAKQIERDKANVPAKERWEKYKIYMPGLMDSAGRYHPQSRPWASSFPFVQWKRQCLQLQALGRRGHRRLWKGSPRKTEPDSHSLALFHAPFPTLSSLSISCHIHLAYIMRGRTTSSTWTAPESVDDP